MLGKVDHSCLRRAVVTYNAFFWCVILFITGPGVLVLGIWLYIALGEHEPVVQREGLSVPALIILSAGGASLLAGLFGCLGSLNENRRLLVLWWCCGIKDSSDWQLTPFYTTRVLSLPDHTVRQVAPLSCCVAQHNVTDCNLGNGSALLHPEQIYEKGCGPLLTDWLRHMVIIAGWTVAGVAASMVLALSAVCCLKHAVSGYYV
ncbi:tetraspanin-7-like [Babylonia areolata]|uniref:tetraspanin-7-like n=1 Tax=Babylonia areolata TaxID=304850 RepID=UPI003FD22EED